MHMKVSGEAYRSKSRERFEEKMKENVGLGEAGRLN